jgi:hypothetical protein
MPSKLYTHDLKTPIAKAASVALAIMGSQGVRTWDEVDTSALSDATFDKLDRFYSTLSVLRYPTKIEKKRALTPCISIVVCTKCGGWYTMQLKKNNRAGGVLGITKDAEESLKCVLTTGCGGKVEVARPAIIEGSTKRVQKEEN